MKLNNETVSIELKNGTVVNGTITGMTTRTMGELSPVVKIDGRLVGDGKVGPVTRRLQKAFKQLTAESGVPIPTYNKI